MRCRSRIVQLPSLLTRCLRLCVREDTRNEVQVKHKEGAKTGRVKPRIGKKKPAKTPSMRNRQHHWRIEGKEVQVAVGEGSQALG